jgi:hypothetical protein
MQRQNQTTCFGNLRRDGITDPSISIHGRWSLEALAFDRLQVAIRDGQAMPHSLGPWNRQLPGPVYLIGNPRPFPDKWPCQVLADGQ